MMAAQAAGAASHTMVASSTAVRVDRRSVSRNAADHGASNTGTEDSHDHLNDMEERTGLPCSVEVTRSSRCSLYAGSVVRPLLFVVHRLELVGA